MPNDNRDIYGSRSYTNADESDILALLQPTQPDIPQELTPPTPQEPAPQIDPALAVRQPSFLRRLLTNFLSTIGEDLASGTTAQAVGAGLQQKRAGGAFGAALGATGTLRESKRATRVQEDREERESKAIAELRRKQAEQLETTPIYIPGQGVQHVPKKDAARIRQEILKQETKSKEAEKDRATRISIEEKRIQSRSEIASKSRELEQQRIVLREKALQIQASQGQQRIGLQREYNSILAQHNKDTKDFQVRTNALREQTIRALASARATGETLRALQLQQDLVELETFGSKAEGIAPIKSEAQTIIDRNKPGAAPPPPPGKTTNLSGSMVTVIKVADGKEYELPIGNLQAALASGKYKMPEPK